MARVPVSWDVICAQVSLPADGSLNGFMAPKGSNNLRQSVQSAAIINNPVSDVLDGTLWNRDLGQMSEEIVGTLVCQLFEGIRDYIVQVRPHKCAVCLGGFGPDML